MTTISQVVCVSAVNSELQSTIAIFLWPPRQSKSISKSDRWYLIYWLFLVTKWLDNLNLKWPGPLQLNKFVIVNIYKITKLRVSWLLRTWNFEIYQRRINPVSIWNDGIHETLICCISGIVSLCYKVHFVLFFLIRLGPGFFVDVKF